MRHEPNPGFVLVGILVVMALALWRPKWRPSSTAFGTARWATTMILRRAGMLGKQGLILGRTQRGRLIRLVEYCHILIVGTTGSGKGVSFIIPQLLTYPGSVICFDCKGDLFAAAGAARARMGQRNVRIAPYNGGTDALNPLDTIPRDSPTLIDDARAMAESLVVRQGTEPDPHWCDKSVQVICAVLVFVLLEFDVKDRNLSSVQEIASDPKMLFAVADKLHELGGISARMGNQLKALFCNGEE